MAADQHVAYFHWDDRRDAGIISGDRKFEKYTELFSILPIKQDHGGKMEDIISLAIEHGLSAYDAAYIELAERHNYPLATLDTKLHKAAKSCGIAYDVGFHWTVYSILLNNFPLWGCKPKHPQSR